MCEEGGRQTGPLDELQAAVDYPSLERLLSKRLPDQTFEANAKLLRHDFACAGVKMPVDAACADHLTLLQGG